MGVGDELLAAGQAQRWFTAHSKPSVIVGQDGLPRWADIWDGNPAIYVPTPGELMQPRWFDRHHQICNGPYCRPYIRYPFTEDTGWTFNTDFRARENIARIYLTGADLALGLATAQQYGRYVLVDPWSKHVNLRWPLEYWQQLIDQLRRVMPIVQHVYSGAPLLEGIPHVATPSFRAACSVLAGASLYVRGESGMCHAAAALDIPNVVIWGGCMSWDVLGGYPKQLGVGVSPPCGSWRPCPHCKLAMAAISVDTVIRAVWNQRACYGLG